MTANSKIEWTHHTFNPWWGCSRVSPGCENCYAETFAKRFGVEWGTRTDRRFFGDKHWAETLKWNAAAAKAGERHRVFCASMADVFEDRDDVHQELLKLWNLIEMTPHLDWLLLTKRPENIERLEPEWWRGGWPSNVWAGCTVEDQRRADERIPHLLRVPAAVRFLSCEPLLGPIDLKHWLDRAHLELDPVRPVDWIVNDISWVIVGGESGPGARPFDLAWARSIVEQCKAAGVPAFVKQLGAWPLPQHDRGDLHGRRFKQYVNGLSQRLCISFADKKGGDPSEWPEDLRVREFPEVHQ